jgi:hypothetical protein
MFLINRLVLVLAVIANPLVVLGCANGAPTFLHPVDALLGTNLFLLIAWGILQLCWWVIHRRHSGRGLTIR